MDCQRPVGLRLPVSAPAGRRRLQAAESGGPNGTPMTVSSHEIRRLLGDVDAHTAAEIIGSGATLAELEQVAFYLSRQTDVMADRQQSLSGRALRIYEMIRRNEESPDEP